MNTDIVISDIRNEAYVNIQEKETNSPLKIE